jgi:hypothetical protein
MEPSLEFAARTIASLLEGGDQFRWRFEKFELSGNQLKPVVIPFVGGLFQDLITSLTPELTSITINPLSNAADNTNIVNDTRPNGAFYSLNEEQKQAQINASLRVENPTFHTPLTMDCVSCHTATRALARINGFDFLNRNDGNPNRFQIDSPTSGDLVSLTQKGFAYEVRAFGYLAPTVPSFTKAAINDSARIAKSMNATCGSY